VPCLETAETRLFVARFNDRSRRHDAPAGPHRGAVSVADENLVVKVPYPRSPRGGIVKHVIRFAVVVKIRWRSVWLESHSCDPSGGKGASHSTRSKLKKYCR
jgi:hypothetical protein